MERSKIYLDFNKNIESILANLKKVNKSQIRIPDSLKNLNYCLFYKNIKLKKESDGLTDILNKTKAFLNIKEKIIFVDQKSYVLQVIDDKKFEISKNISSSAQNNQLNEFNFSNVKLETLLLGISLFYKISIKDETNFKGYYSFQLSNNSIENTNNSLSNYGLYLKLISDKTIVYEYE